jgi:acyl-CoA thioester hydrolase
MLEEFRKVVAFRVPFADIDMLRHANNTAYLRWAETARSEYLIEVMEADIGGRTGMILARLDISYESPINYRENVAIGCRVSRLGTKSFDFTHEVWSVDREVRCARIVTTMVAMDYASETSIAVPPQWRERIAAYEVAAVNA